MLKLIATSPRSSSGSKIEISTSNPGVQMWRLIATSGLFTRSSSSFQNVKSIQATPVFLGT